MDIGKAFSYVTNDPDWLKKILIGGIISMIPVINFASMGYVVEVIRRVANDDPYPLPDWDNFGVYFSEGFKVFVGLFVYVLPAVLLAGFFMVIMVAAGGFSGNLDSDTGGALLGGGIFLLQCVMFIYVLVVSIVMPAAIARFAEVGTIASMLQFGEIFAFIRNNLGSYVIMLLVWFAVSYIIAPLGIIACFVGVIFTGWWSYLVFGHMLGQLVRQNALAV